MLENFKTITRPYDPVFEISPVYTNSLSFVWTIDVCHRYCYEIAQQKGITKSLFSLVYLEYFTAYLIQISDELLEFNIFP